MEGTWLVEVSPLITYLDGGCSILLIRIGTAVIRPQVEIWSEVLQKAGSNHLIAMLPGHIILCCRTRNRTSCPSIIFLMTNNSPCLLRIGTQIIQLQLSTMSYSALQAHTGNSKGIILLMIRLPIESSSSQVFIIQLIVESDTISFLAKCHNLEAKATPLTTNIQRQLLVYIAFNPQPRVELGILPVSTDINRITGINSRIWTIAMEISIIRILVVDFPFSADLPIIIHLILSLQAQIITVIICHAVILAGIVILIANLAKAAKLQLINKILHLVDGSSILLDLLLHLLQGLQLARQLLSYTVNQGIISKAATLVGIGNNLGHLVTRHRLITLEGAIWIALQYAILGQNFQGAICPMSLRYIIKSFLRKRCTLLCLGCHSRSCRHA